MSFFTSIITDIYHMLFVSKPIEETTEEGFAYDDNLQCNVVEIDSDEYICCNDGKNKDNSVTCLPVSRGGSLKM